MGGIRNSKSKTQIKWLKYCWGKVIAKCDGNFSTICYIRCPRLRYKNNLVSNILPIAPPFSSSTSLIPGPALDLYWSNYKGWPPTGRLSKGPLKINIHSFRSVIRFWHYRPCSVSALPLSLLYSSINLTSYQCLDLACTRSNWRYRRYFWICSFANCYFKILYNHSAMALDSHCCSIVSNMFCFSFSKHQMQRGSFVIFWRDSETP